MLKMLMKKMLVGTVSGIILRTSVRNSYGLKSPFSMESAKHGLIVDLQMHIFSVRWAVFIFLRNSKHKVSINKAMASPPLLILCTIHKCVDQSNEATSSRDFTMESSRE